MTILSSDHGRIMLGLSSNYISSYRLYIGERNQGLAGEILNAKFRGRRSIW